MSNEIKAVQVSNEIKVRGGEMRLESNERVGVVGAEGG